MYRHIDEILNVLWSIAEFTWAIVVQRSCMWTAGWCGKGMRITECWRAWRWISNVNACIFVYFMYRLGTTCIHFLHSSIYNVFFSFFFSSLLHLILLIRHQIDDWWTTPFCVVCLSRKTVTAYKIYCALVIMTNYRTMQLSQATTPMLLTEFRNYLIFVRKKITFRWMIFQTSSFMKLKNAWQNSYWYWRVRNWK